MNPCLFCKRRDRKCLRYNIYSCLQDDVYPYIDIIELLGDVKKYLKDNRVICHECLFVIRAINLFRGVLLDNVKIKDFSLTGALVSVIPGFQVFKNQLESDHIYQDPRDISDEDEEAQLDNIEEQIENNVGEPIENDNCIKIVNICAENDNNSGDSDRLTEAMYSVDLETDYSSRGAPTPNSQEIEDAFYKKKRRRRGRTRFTHRKGEQKSRTNSRLYSRASNSSSHPRSRVGSRASSTRTSRATSVASVYSRSEPEYDDDDNLITMETRYISQLDAERRERKVKLDMFPCQMKVCMRRFENMDEVAEHLNNEHCLSEEVLMNDYIKLLDEKNEEERNKSKSRPQTPNPYKDKYKYPCLIKKCLKECYTFDDLTEHKSNGHNAIAKYWCTECIDVRFTTQADLTFHTMLKHNVKTNCLLCPELMNNAIELQQHLREHKYFSFPCKYCDQCFLDYKSLEHHQNNHDSDQRRNRIKRGRKHTILSRADMVTSDVASDSKVEAIVSEFTRIREQSGQVEKDLDYAFLFSGNDFAEVIDENRTTSDESEAASSSLVNEDEILDNNKDIIIDMNDEKLMETFENCGGDLLLDSNEGKSIDGDINLPVDDDQYVTVAADNFRAFEETFKDNNLFGDSVEEFHDGEEKDVPIVEKSIPIPNPLVAKENGVKGKEDLKTIKKGDVAVEKSVTIEGVDIEKNTVAAKDNSVTVKETSGKIEKTIVAADKPNASIEEISVAAGEPSVLIVDTKVVTEEPNEGSSVTVKKPNVTIEETSAAAEIINTLPIETIKESNVTMKVEETKPKEDKLFLEELNKYVGENKQKRKNVELDVEEEIIAAKILKSKIETVIPEPLKLDEEDVLKSTKLYRPKRTRRFPKKFNVRNIATVVEKMKSPEPSPLKLVIEEPSNLQNQEEYDSELLKKKPIVLLSDIMPAYVALNEKKLVDERVQIESIPNNAVLDDSSLLASLNSLKKENIVKTDENVQNEDILEKHVTILYELRVRLSPLDDSAFTNTTNDRTNDNTINDVVDDTFSSPIKKSRFIRQDLTITPIDPIRSSPVPIMAPLNKKRKKKDELSITPVVPPVPPKVTKGKKKKPIPADLNAMPLNEPPFYHPPPPPPLPSPPPSYNNNIIDKKKIKQLPPNVVINVKPTPPKSKPPNNVKPKPAKRQPKIMEPIVLKHLLETISRVASGESEDDVKKVSANEKIPRPSVTEEEAASTSLSQSALFTKSAMERLNRKKDFLAAGSSKWS